MEIPRAFATALVILHAPWARFRGDDNCYASEKEDFASGRLDGASERQRDEA